MKTDDIVQAHEWLIDITNRMSKEYDITEDTQLKTCIHFFFLTMKHLAKDELWKIEDPEDYERHWEAIVEMMEDHEDDDGE